jgi:hypothetical protein
MYSGNYWIISKAACAACGTGHPTNAPCRDCKPSQHRLPNGQPAFIGYPTNGGSAQLIPTGRFCGTCRNTGTMTITYGFAAGEAQTYRDAISKLRDLTQNYKRYQEEEAKEFNYQYKIQRAAEAAAIAQEREKQADAEKQRIAQIEYEKAVKEVQARKIVTDKLEKERKETAEKLKKEREKERREIADLQTLCTSEIESIKMSIHQLEETGNPEVKKRLQVDDKYSNNVLFSNLIQHFAFTYPSYIVPRTYFYSEGTALLTPFQMRKDSNNYFKFKLKDLGASKIVKYAQAHNLTLFEACFEYNKQIQLNIVRNFIRVWINHFNPSMDHHSNWLFDLSAHYVRGEYEHGWYGRYTPFALPENILTPFFFSNEKNGAQDLSWCTYVTFEDLMAIRNEVWNESLFNRFFRKATQTHFNEETDNKDEELRKRWKAQITFMQNYWDQTQLNLEVPPQFQSSHPDLQREQMKLQYFQSLQTHGQAMVGNKRVDAMSFHEVEQRTKFQFFPGKSYTRPTTYSAAPYSQQVEDNDSKKISIDQLEQAWRTYQQRRKDKLFKSDTSPESFNVYNQAKSSLYTDECRYRMLCEYVLNPANQQREFYKTLITQFDRSFFIKEPIIVAGFSTSSI